MSARAVVLVVLLALGGLPFLGAEAQTDPHPRSPDLAAGGDVTALAMARSSGWVAAGINDTGGRGLGQEVSATVWRVWDESGNLVRTGDGDVANCSTMVFDSCQGDVVAIGLSDDGNRIAVAVRDRGEMAGRVVFATMNQGIILRHELAEAPTSLAMAADGQRIAVGTIVDNGVAADLGAAYLFTWSAGSGSNPGTVAQLWRNQTAEAVTKVALGESGTATRVAAAATGSHYRFINGAGIRHDAASTIISVAFTSSSSERWSVAGASDGGVLLYSDDSDASPYVPVLDLRPGTLAQNDVAIATDGSYFFAGDAEGKVRLFRNPFVLGTGGSTLVATSAALGGPVRDLALSGDGRHLAVAAGPDVALFRVAADRLDPVWSHAKSAAVAFTGISSNGDLVAASVGAAATVYTAVHAITATPPAATPTAQPGLALPFAVIYRNTGNREETVSVEVAFPADWTGSVAPSSVTLKPGQDAAVTIFATPPGFAAAGPQEVRVTHRVQGIPTLTVVSVQVAHVRAWTLQTDDAPNQDIQAGGSLQLTFQLKNMGNAQDTTQVLLSVDNPAWTASVAPANVTLSRNGEAQVVVTLRAPSGAAELASARLTVSLSADPRASLSASATVGARFGLAASAPSGTFLATQAGQTLPVTVRAGNTGNTADTYVVQVNGAPLGWAVSYPDATDRIEAVPAGGSGEARLQVAIPADAQTGTYAMAVVLRSLGDPAHRATVALTIEVEALPEPEPPKDKGIPGPAMPLLLGALALAALAGRRKTH